VEKFTKNIFDFPVNGISMDELIPIRKLTHQPTKGSSSPNPQTLNTKPFSGSSSPKFKVLYAGRFDPIKAVPLAVRTFAEFNKKHPDSIFEIIGDGPEKERIEKEVEEYNIPESINLISWLPREELIKKMREVDVFIFPSLRDGGGAVVVEAMASGLPVICLDLAGPGFHIQNRWGIKIEAKNPEYVVIEMAKALEKLYLDNNLRIQMGINARKRAEEYYLWDHLGERLQSIYKDALKSGK
jgi:glycosyltransferase involved in cell wall biosynthesis